jgi:hypothetical protein
MTIFTRLFGRRLGRARDLGYVEAQRQVLDYARYLENSPVMPGCIVDESRLPHPKEELKSSLLQCIGNSSDPRLGEHLKSGYLMLCAFQPDVGDMTLGTDFATLDLEQDSLTIATRVEQDSELAGPWQRQVQNELGCLREDLHKLELLLAEPPRLSA